jgi:penicillin-binding protein 1A
MPIWTEFMAAALEDAPATPFRTPPGVRMVRVDGETGLLPGATTQSTIDEAFLPGTEPSRRSTSSIASTSATGEAGSTAASGAIEDGAPTGLY